MALAAIPQPPVAIDWNPDPDIVEVLLVAYPELIDYGLPSGALTYSYTFNGSVPAPTIRATSCCGA